MSRLAGLDPHFVEGNVALGVLLGALGACATVRAALPPPEPASINPHNGVRVTQVREGERVDAFVALLLGAVVMHERLSAIVDHHPELVDDHAAFDAPNFPGGLLR